MRIQRCKDQGKETLRRYYRQAQSESGDAMVRLLNRLSEHPDSLQSWGLTSYGTLWLLDRNEYTAKRARINASPEGYNIAYFNSQEGSSWRFISGVTQDENAAVQMVMTALERTQPDGTET